MAIPKPAPNPPWVFKKNFKPVINPFIKIELRSIREGGMGIQRNPPHCHP